MSLFAGQDMSYKSYICLTLSDRENINKNKQTSKRQTKQSKSNQKKKKSKPNQ